MSNMMFLMGVAMLVEALTGEKLADIIGWWNPVKAMVAAFIMDSVRIYISMKRHAAMTKGPAR